VVEQPTLNPPMRVAGVSVAIVVGGRESRTQGEGPQLEGCLKVRPSWMLRLGNPGQCREKEVRVNPLRRPPCAVKAACTVTTGGMERRTERYRALSLPTAEGGTSGAIQLGRPGSGQGCGSLCR
jgi:hypothetical protein